MSEVPKTFLDSDAAPEEPEEELDDDEDKLEALNEDDGEREEPDAEEEEREELEADDDDALEEELEVLEELEELEELVEEPELEELEEELESRSEERRDILLRGGFIERVPLVRAHRPACQQVSVPPVETNGQSQ